MEVSRYIALQHASNLLQSKILFDSSSCVFAVSLSNNDIDARTDGEPFDLCCSVCAVSPNQKLDANADGKKNSTRLASGVQLQKSSQSKERKTKGQRDQLARNGQGRRRRQEGVEVAKQANDSSVQTAEQAGDSAGCCCPIESDPDKPKPYKGADRRTTALRKQSGDQVRISGVRGRRAKGNVGRGKDGEDAKEDRRTNHVRVDKPGKVTKESGRDWHAKRGADLEGSERGIQLDTLTIDVRKIGNGKRHAYRCQSAQSDQNTEGLEGLEGDTKVGRCTKGAYGHRKERQKIRGLLGRLSAGGHLEMEIGEKETKMDHCASEEQRSKDEKARIGRGPGRPAKKLQ